jgi:hypothetical protein
VSKTWTKNYLLSVKKLGIKESTTLGLERFKKNQNK